MIPIWPANLPQRPSVRDFTGSPLNAVASFAPEDGPSIDRPKVTAETWVYGATFERLTFAQRTAFLTFWRDALKRGALAFAWPDPVEGTVWTWKIRGGRERAFELVPRLADRCDLKIGELMRLPGPPWWQPYALVTAAGAARLPFAVADYTAGVFGVDLARSTGAAVAAVSGTFDVYTTATGGTVTIEAAHAVSAGDIPATAPGGVAKIVAYPV